MEPNNVALPNVKNLAGTLSSLNLQSPKKPQARRSTDPARLVEPSPRSKAAEEILLKRSSQIMMENKDLIDLKAKERQVKHLVDKLNDTSSERRKELAERLEEIRLLVLGKPQKDSDEKSVIKVSTSVVEMLRLAGSTSIVDCGKEKQAIREDSHIREAPVDVVDLAKRFSRLFEIYQRCAGDKTKLPDTAKWTPDECQKWAVEMESKGCYNEKMRRFIRSSSQATYTGSLSKKDVLMHALDPNFSTVANSNKLHITVPACSQKLYRLFFEDNTFGLKIVLPFEMKNEQKIPFARVITEYMIIFDADMNPISLTSKTQPAMA